MKLFRITLWLAIFALGAFLAYSTVPIMLRGDQSPIAATADVGGPFTALNASGETFGQKDMLGRPHVMFFGFTHCPDICPTTLYEASQWLQELGPQGDQIDVYFVSVDPERDTPEALSRYLSGFDPRIKGITGSLEQISDLARKWRVFIQKVGEGDDYTVSHTSNSFLMNSKGQFVRTIAYGENAEVAVSKIKKLLEEEG